MARGMLSTMSVKTLLLVPLLVAACTSPTIDGPIDYTTSGGFSGGGEGTSLHVELDGRATRTTNGTTDQLTLDAATIDRLHAAVYDAFPIDRTFEGCCDSIVDEVSVTLDGDIDHLIVDRANERVPDDVTALLDLVRSL